MLILPMYTDDERVELEKKFKIKIEKLNLIKDKNSKEYKELQEETKLMYEIIHGL